MNLYIGLMSGTSVDGIDAALVHFENNQMQVIETHYTPYAAPIRQRILDLCQPGENEIQRMGELDRELGIAFAETSLALLDKTSFSAKQIKAIGSHGQTIRHSPKSAHSFSMQIGDPNTIAALTNITTIADFRRKDMALQGQGAPLVPAFHQMFFGNNTNRAIVNIGGIANITLLMPNQPMSVLGFDTGPGNTLMDAWIASTLGNSFDKDGQLAAQGHVNTALLSQLLEDAYFHLAPPKSTGREYFHLDWLKPALTSNLSPADVQATLVELTARTIIDSIKQYFSSGDVLICGGGARNSHLMQRILLLAGNDLKVASTEAYGLHPDWVEATAFAWLAKQTLNQLPGNLPKVTGATRPAILGGIYQP